MLSGEHELWNAHVETGHTRARDPFAAFGYAVSRVAADFAELAARMSRAGIAAAAAVRRLEAGLKAGRLELGPGAQAGRGEAAPARRDPAALPADRVPETRNRTDFPGTPS